jgi:hypothetical protein
MSEPITKTRLRRPWFHFGLRQLFVTFTLLILLVGTWASYHVKWIQARKEARQWIRAHPHPPPDGRSRLGGGGGGGPAPPQRPLPWALAFFGEKREAIAISIYVNETDEREGYLKTIENIKQLFPESTIHDESGWSDDAIEEEEGADEE